MTIGAIIQARMNSQRFPGKVLYKINNKCLLQYVIESVSHCKKINQIVVATSLDEGDKPVEEFCRTLGVSCFRGPLQNVAERFNQVITWAGLEAFVRVNGDSPLLDHRLIDKGVSIYLSGEYDIVTNVFKRTFPKGQSVEVVSSKSFKAVCKQMEDEEDKEHVTRYFYRYNKKYKMFNFESGKEWGDIQLSVDSSEDMDRFKNIVVHMKKSHWEYTVEDIVSMHFRNN
jgi:spore coat polysaccharide biosynthesis protein SpsF (cytidylyltransferase family)